MMSPHHALQGQQEGTGPTLDHFSVHLWMRSTAAQEEGTQVTNKMKTQQSQS